jgi:hypothetical protein
MFHRLKSLFAAKPPVEFRHSEFGVLTFESGLWSGETQRDGRNIRFCIGGTDIAPNAGLLDRVRELVGRFPGIERTALDFLCAQDKGVRRGDFDFYSLDLLWENKPQLYTLEFSLAGDDDGIWRVEFENEQPKYRTRRLT